MTQFALFDTVIGRCALAWGERALVGVSLPDSSPERTRVYLRRTLPDAVEADPPAWVREVMDRIAAMFDGAPDDLSDIELDYGDFGEFNRTVYELARTIPPGKTASYGEIAARAGAPGAAQAVGQAMGANRFPIIVPCHRVLAAGGKIGGFSAPGWIHTKRKMLTIEGALPPTLFD